MNTNIVEIFKTEITLWWWFQERNKDFAKEGA